MILDTIGAVRAWLLGQTAITDLVGQRVFVNAIPRDVIEAEPIENPSKMIVVRMAGGAGKSDFMDFQPQTMDVLCYGETQLEADKVRREVFAQLFEIDRVRQGDVLIHWANPAGGPVSLVDPDIVWPAISQSYEIATSIKEIAA